MEVKVLLNHLPENAEVRLGADEPDGEGGRLEVLAHSGGLVVLEEGQQADVRPLVDASEDRVWVARAALQGHGVVERVGDGSERKRFYSSILHFAEDFSAK